MENEQIFTSTLKMEEVISLEEKNQHCSFVSSRRFDVPRIFLKKYLFQRISLHGCYAHDNLKTDYICIDIL